MNMARQKQLLEDFARVATGAMGAFTGMRGEVENRLKERIERILGRANLVRREEFDAVRAMAAKARAAQETLEQRVASLEAKLGVRAPAPAAKRRANKAAPAAKRRAGPKRG